MKTRLLSAAILVALSGAAMAQDTYSAYRLSSSDLNGTARYVGMGGAMNALGGDISVISSNPAGIGIYRHSEVTVTGSFNSLSGDAYGKSSGRASLDNLGLVYSLPYSNVGSLRFINYGVSYRKKKNFFDDLTLNMDMGGQSQTFQIARMANDCYSHIPTYLNEWGNLPYHGSQAALLDIDDSGYHGVGAKSASYRRELTGGISEYDFNISCNIEDQLYLGATLGVYDVNFSSVTSYSEVAADATADPYSYNVSNWSDVTGSGIDIKLGAIIRPIEDSPFRIGVSVQSPTYYSLTDKSSFLLYNTARNTDLSYSSERVDLGNYDYRLETPWRFNISAGTTVGGMMAIGAEYEYEDFSTIKMRDIEGNTYDFLDRNDETRDMLKGVGTIKVGAEARLTPEFSVRAGYNHSSAVFQDDAYRHVYYNSTLGSTDYNNDAETSRFTLGVGYRGERVSADIAYQYSTTKSTLYTYEGHSGVKNDLNRSQVLFTLGYSF